MNGLREVLPGVRLIGGMLLIVAVAILVGRLIAPMDNVVSVPGGFCVTDVGICFAR